MIPSDLKELRETWEELDLGDRHTLEKQYGKERLRQAFQEYDSFQWIESNAKRCPTCSAKIQKTQGCNKMNVHTAMATSAGCVMLYSQDTNRTNTFELGECLHVLESCLKDWQV